MTIRHAIWKVGHMPVALAPAELISEQNLEDMIVAAPAKCQQTNRASPIQAANAVVDGAEKIFAKKMDLLAGSSR